MLPTAKSKAEEQREAMRKMAKRSLKEKERAQQKRADQTARLRAARLGHEVAEDTHGKDVSGGNNKTLRLPKVHRSQT